MLDEVGHVMVRTDSHRTFQIQADEDGLQSSDTRWRIFKLARVIAYCLEERGHVLPTFMRHVLCNGLLRGWRIWGERMYSVRETIGLWSRGRERLPGKWRKH